MVKLSAVRIAEATIKAIVETTEGVRLQVSFGEETARIYEMTDRGDRQVRFWCASDTGLFGANPVIRSGMASSVLRSDMVYGLGNDRFVTV
jgi:hypothetical protein